MTKKSIKSVDVSAAAVNVIDCRGELLDSRDHNYKCIYRNIMISSDKNVKNLFKILYGHFLFFYIFTKRFLYNA
ncbi:CRPV-142 [Crowpox virus]|nr:CRPV-142 [Crowpox virus]